MSWIAGGGDEEVSPKLTRRSDDTFLGDLDGEEEPRLLPGVSGGGECSDKADRSAILPVLAKSVGSNAGNNTQDAKQCRPPIAMVLPGTPRKLDDKEFMMLATYQQ